MKIQHLLKSYRERTGMMLQDMATLIGVDIGNLSKVEHGKLEPNIIVIFAYHLILKIPIERLFKYHYSKVSQECLENAGNLREKLLDAMISPNLSKRQVLLDSVIDRLRDMQEQHVC